MFMEMIGLLKCDLKLYMEKFDELREDITADIDGEKSAQSEARDRKAHFDLAVENYSPRP